MNCNITICVFRWFWATPVKGWFNPQGSWNPQVKNHWSRKSKGKVQVYSEGLERPSMTSLNGCRMPQMDICLLVLCFANSIFLPLSSATFFSLGKVLAGVFITHRLCLGICGYWNLSLQSFEGRPISTLEGDNLSGIQIYANELMLEGRQKDAGDALENAISAPRAIGRYYTIC